MVMVDRKIEGLNIDSVSINNELGGYLATKKLIESGHTEIGIVCGIKGLSNTTERLSGYHRALREAGIKISQRFISYGNYVEEGGREAMKELLSLDRSEEHTSELQSRGHLVCRLLLEKKNRKYQ